MNHSALFYLSVFISFYTFASVWEEDEFPALGEGELIEEKLADTSHSQHNQGLTQNLVLNLGMSRLKANYRSYITDGDFNSFGKENNSGTSVGIGKYFDFGREGNGLWKIGMNYQSLEFNQSGNSWRTDNLVMELTGTIWYSEHFYSTLGANYTLLTQGRMKSKDYELNQSNFTRQVGHQLGIGFSPQGEKSSFMVNLKYVSVNQGVHFSKRIDGERVQLKGNLNYFGFILGTEFLY